MTICNEEGCTKHATSNYKNQIKRVYCTKHKKENMIDLDHRTKYCIETECTKVASYNFPNEKKAIYCNLHMKENMINIKSKRCIEEGCNLLPSYNYEGETTRLYCKNHAKENMINLGEKKCIQENCTKNAYYNIRTERERLYCRDHADLTTMVDLTHLDKLCISPNCGIQACFNIPTEKKPLYCSTHSTEEMEDVRTNKCIEEGCKTKPSFNYQGTIGALYCITHAKDDMINIYDSKCTAENCTVSASYNYPNSKKRLFCTKHKLEGMVQLSKEECQIEGCSTVPKYNFPNEKKGIYCGKHKTEGMIHLTESFCRFEGCKKHPTFNFPGNCPRFCLKHIEPGMINTKDAKCQDCPKQASFAFKGEKLAQYCYDHSKEGMRNICSKRCKEETCDTIISNKKYEGYCFTCFKLNNPDHKITLNYCVKEFAIRDFVKEKFPDKDWIFNKPIKNGTSKKRPDILLDCDTHVLIVEIDECQHSLYDDVEEEKRMHEIVTDLQNKNTIFIRFNPDSYTDSDSNFVKSPWVYYKQTIKISSIKDVQEEWNNRLNTLYDTINHHINNGPERLVEYIKLFYSNCN